MVGGWLVQNTTSSDTWNYHRWALDEYDLLFTHPNDYFFNILYTGYSNGYGGMLQTQHSFWNDLKDNLMIKLVSVLDIFSGGRYYVNVVLYNFLIFWGTMGLYRVFGQVYKLNRIMIAVIVFLLPSVLLYSSTIHKDGVVLALISITVYHFYNAMHDRVTAGRILSILLSLFLIFFFRNFVLMAMLPALLAWLLSEKKVFSPAVSFAAVYLVTGLLFFCSHYIVPAVNLPQYMVQKQADFFALEKGNTTIPLDTLQANPARFAAAAPQAMQHGLLRPFITDVSLSKLLLPLSAELIVYEILVMLFFFSRRKDFRFGSPFTFLCLFFALSLCLIIGYTVPVIGAIVRYRSVLLPFLLLPFIAGTDWKKLATFAKIKK